MTDQDRSIFQIPCAGGPMSQRLRATADWLATQAGAALQATAGNRCSTGFGILMYHRVTEHVPGVDTPTWNVSPRRFRSQLAGLLRRGFRPRPLSQLLAAHRQGEPISSNIFAVTIDDGFENNYVHAWPVLRELEVPATFFLPTKYLDSGEPLPFDDWSAKGSHSVPAETWRPLTLAQCRELHASGLIELGAHTHSHHRFRGCSDAFRTDLNRCLEVLNERFGIVGPAFAFPFGDYDEEMLEIARQLGVACCLSTSHRRNCVGEAFCLSRFTATQSDTPASLAAKLSGWTSSIAAAGKAVQRQVRGAGGALFGRRRARPVQSPRDPASTAERMGLG